jgi:DNA-directed RNA polymerase specialized sigma24 family protein
MKENSETKRLEIITEIKYALQKDDTLYNRLLQKENRLLKKYFKDKEVVIEPGDILMELIVKMVSGERNWNGKVPIEAYMFNNLESIIHNHSKKEYRKSRLFKESNNEDSEPQFIDGIEKFITKEDISNELEKKEFYKFLEDEIMGDNDCISYYLEIREANFDYTKNKEAAAALGWTVSKVENIKKRFLTHCNKIFIKYYN